SVKEQCRSPRRHHRNRFVSAVSFAASAEEANYTPGPHTRQHLLREKAGKFISKPINRRQAHDPTEDMKKGYLSVTVKKGMPARFRRAGAPQNKQAGVAAGLFQCPSRWSL
ncbi:hypothetical protein, partial [Chromobacterium vaccinii]|uniref:hypothetical protein n=1 Tax=Chromobacterium vaccinii TaxID=1108595 RepID=UPI001E30EE2A